MNLLKQSISGVKLETNWKLLQNSLGASVSKQKV